MEFVNPSLTMVTLVAILFITICIRLWYRPKNPIACKTKTWISKDDARHLILRSSLITRIKAKHGRPRGYYSEIESVIRWAKTQRDGPDAREAGEEKEIEDAVRYNLMVIEEKYPPVKNEKGEYSKEIIEYVLLIMAAVQ